MARIQPVLAKTEAKLGDQAAHRLTSKELGLLAKKLANAKNPTEAARLRRSITQGFYGSH